MLTLDQLKAEADRVHELRAQAHERQMAAPAGSEALARAERHYNQIEGAYHALIWMLTEGKKEAVSSCYPRWWDEYDKQQGTANNAPSGQ